MSEIKKIAICEDETVAKLLSALNAAQAEITKLKYQLEEARLDARAQEALRHSDYKAGMKLGWNLCVDNANEEFQRRMASTEHVAELKRIRDARANLSASASEITDTLIEEARAKAIEECADDVEMETSIAPKAWERSDDYAAGWLDCRERAVAVIRALLNGSAK